MKKIFIDANQLQRDSFALAKKVIENNYQPTFLIGLWRGGSPIAITVHEVLEYCGMPIDHISVRVSSYSDIETQSDKIKIHDLSYVKDNITTDDRILIVDDVHDTGLSMAKLLTELKTNTAAQQIKIAVAYYKPEKSQVNFEPDFFVNTTKEWLVFPHELCGLDDDEIAQQKPGIEEIKTVLLNKSKLTNN